MGQKEKYLLRFTHLYLVHRLSWCRSIYFLSQCIEKCVSERLATAAVVVDKVHIIKSCGGLIFMKNLRFGQVWARYIFNPIYNCFYFRLVKEANIRFVCTGGWPQLPPTIVVVLGIQAVERLYVMTGLRNKHSSGHNSRQSATKPVTFLFCFRIIQQLYHMGGHSLRTGSAAGKNYIVNIKMKLQLCAGPNVHVVHCT